MPLSEATPFHPTHHVGKAAALALRLAEAENALHTLTLGQVDAIISPSGQAYLMRAAQERLRQNEEQQRAVMESAADVLMVVDRAGIIHSANRAVHRLLGYAPEELVESMIFEFIHEADASAVHSAFVSVVEGSEETATVVFRHLTRAGTYRSVEGALIKLQDVPMKGVVFNLRLITGDPEAMPSIHTEEDAGEPLSPGKDRFLAMLAHELRAPMTPVLLSLATLLRDVRFAAAYPALTMIQRNIELQARLLEELNDFAAIGQHKMRLRLASTDAHEVVNLVLETCGEEIAATAIEVRLDLRASQSVVLADSLRLQQVMWNLVKNAVKFSSPGGRVSIASANDTVGSLTLEFVDHGIGIAPELLPLVFDPLQQGDDTMQRRYGGMGLGLFIARGLAEAHQGTLTVASKGQGQGATFRLSLKTIGQTT